MNMLCTSLQFTNFFAYTLGLGLTTEHSVNSHEPVQQHLVFTTGISYTRSILVIILHAGRQPISSLSPIMFKRIYLAHTYIIGCKDTGTVNDTSGAERRSLRYRYPPGR
jgi:hypothetical protein